MEYDTYRDPAGPLGATAQVLFGAVIDFVTGLVDLPAEIVGNLLSAGSTLRRPREQFDPYVQCQRHRRSQHGEIRNGEESSGENDQHETESEDQEMAQEDQNQQPFHDKIIRSRLYQAHSETAFFITTIFKKALRLVVWFPTDLSLSISRGFHNAPMLYHDPMVRPTPKVTHIRSGFKAAGKELKNGLYDGITGLVSQPLYGLKHNDAKGMIKGLGKGIGGFVLKPLAGISGLAGYPLSGLREKLNDSLGKPMGLHLESSRIAQGREEMRSSTMEARMEVIKKWNSIEKTQVVNRGNGYPGEE